MTINNNKASSVIADWLWYVRAAAPPAGVIFIGVGTGSSSLVRLLREWETPKTILVEADERQYQHLEHSIGQVEGWQLRNVLVTADDQQTVFYRASNPAESGLIDPENLRSLWPNLKREQAIADIPHVRLKELMEETGTKPGWLLLDCLPSGKLLLSAADMLSSVDVIMVRVNTCKETSSLVDIDHNELEAWLGDQGFRLLIAQPERHPELAELLFIRDIQILQNQNFRQQQLLEKLYEKNEGLQKANKRYQRRELDLANEITKLKKNRAEQLEELSSFRKKIKELEQEQSKSLKEVENHKRSLFVETEKRKELKELQDKKLRETSGDLDLQPCCRSVDDTTGDTPIETTFRSIIDNAVRQGEAFLNIRDFFNGGEYLPEMHGWAVSPDFALYLIELIVDSDYDLVIEFGSGTSTLLIAKAIARSSSKRNGKSPVLQVAFEHIENYHAKTAAQLRRFNLEKNVQLVSRPVNSML